MWITYRRRYEDLPNQLAFEDLVDIFEERIYGWHLHIAEQMVKPIEGENGEIIDRTIPHCDFAALQIVVSYFETIAKYYDGFAEDGRSREYFRRGVRLWFNPENAPDGNLTDDLLNALYSRVRNALYHATTTQGIGVTSEPFVLFGVDIQRNEIVLNTHEIVPDLIRHLRQYCACLRDPTESELRDNFLRRFKFDQETPSLH